eukprot:10727496-Heterocapsa_arctica.AAC.1
MRLRLGRTDKGGAAVRAQPSLPSDGKETRERGLSGSSQDSEKIPVGRLQHEQRGRRQSGETGRLAHCLL